MEFTRMWRLLLRTVVPIGVHRVARDLRQLPATSRPEYLRWWLASRMGGAASMPHVTAVRTVVFVCYGNIMRSPMAAALLARRLEQTGLAQTIRVLSAGLHMRPGRYPPPLALEAAAAFGVSLAGHQSLTLTTKVVESADVLFVMDFLNAAELSARWPEARSKVRLLGPLGANGHTQIVDPYGTDLATTIACYRQIAEATEVLALRLGYRPRPPTAK